MSLLSHLSTGTDIIAHLQERQLLLHLAEREEGPVSESSSIMLGEVEATGSNGFSAGKEEKPEGPKLATPSWFANWFANSLSLLRE